jgi:queuosine precursor transporter
MPALNTLIFLHIVLIISSNILVQYPVSLLGYHATMGTFTYPLIFILTDLTTRILGPTIARKVIFIAMIPSLLLSYLIPLVINSNHYSQLLHLNLSLMRVAIACFCAYLFGQLLDIYIFQRLRQNNAWWVAPTLSSSAGNVFDTYCFFFIAFYQSNTPFLSDNWQEIALVDVIFKLLISYASFIPLYGLILKTIVSRHSYRQMHSKH